ncbi:OLC1v1005759C1 [Oldenlandia corymbosa var. corymbosa]|uniref:OLC1v1005759C1 n=1 Tax=Oldenlandia corymbosa var. corymbosa TaxID=529605 RepID=A0AAV1DFC6_OLDCO|nr:OLC1v1005759C1 [Oldenlandia corymbosa var. corymbosa]
MDHHNSDWGISTFDLSEEKFYILPRYDAMMYSSHILRFGPTVSLYVEESLKNEYRIVPFPGAPSSTKIKDESSIRILEPAVMHNEYFRILLDGKVLISVVEFPPKDLAEQTNIFKIYMIQSRGKQHRSSSRLSVIQTGIGIRPTYIFVQRDILSLRCLFP